MPFVRGLRGVRSHKLRGFLSGRFRKMIHPARRSKLVTDRTSQTSISRVVIYWCNTTMQDFALNVRFRVAAGFFGRDQVRHTRPPGHGRGNGRRKARLERRHERPARPYGLRHTGNIRAPPLASLPQGNFILFFILLNYFFDFSRGDLCQKPLQILPRDIRLGSGRRSVDTQLSRLFSPRMLRTCRCT